MSDSNTYPTQKGISGIYEIYCVSNGARYIGSAVCLVRRKRHHLDMLRHSRHTNIHLQRAWSLYGSSVFEFRILEFCDSDLLLEREQYFIDTLHPEFNIAFYAGSPMKGRNHTEEAIRGISEKQSGKKFTEEHKRKIGSSKIGKPRSEETKQKLSIFFTRQAEAGNHKGYHKLIDADIPKIRALHLKGLSQTEIGNLFGVDHSTIGRIINHRYWKRIP
jgi:group I intron endonuclease